MWNILQDSGTGRPARLQSNARSLRAFDQRWKHLPHKNLPVSEQVDYRLLGSALARVHWELEVNKRWERDPTFYVDQAITGVLEALLAPPPFHCAAKPADPGANGEHPVGVPGRHGEPASCQTVCRTRVGRASRYPAEADRVSPKKLGRC